MSKKRLIVSFVAVLTLLAIAAIIELILCVLPNVSEVDSGLVPYALQQSSSTQLSESTSMILGQQNATQQEAKQLEIIHQESSKKDTTQQDTLEKKIVKQKTPEHVLADELVNTGSIIVEGTQLQSDMAESIVNAAKPFNSAVDFIDQRPILASGCEIVSLVVALRAEGYDAAPEIIADAYLRIGSDFAVDFVGNPRGNGGGFPICIADAGNAWLVDTGNAAQVLNLTGTSFQGVSSLVNLGYPVLIWTTEGYVHPVHEGEERNGLQWYNREHCVVVYGIEDEEVLVADSLAGLVRCNRAEFEQIYAECGNLALFVLPHG